MSKKQAFPPVLQILNGSHKGKQFRLLSSLITIGSHSDCDVIFKNKLCSPHHARIKKEKDFYFIESLDSSNPVLVNNKPVDSHLLRSKDRVTIGSMNFLFMEKAPLADLQKTPAGFSSSQKKSSLLTPPRLMFLFVLGVLAFLFLSDTKTQKEEVSLKTSADILKDVEDLKALNEEESEKKNLNPQEKRAQALFIKGFRDYGKGYFDRALKLFERCLTLQKNHPLCTSYVQKSKVHIEKLIQKKIRLGEAYKANKQYSACQATFESVENMLKDSSSPVFKSAQENRRLCEVKLKNKI